MADMPPKDTANDEEDFFPPTPASEMHPDSPSDEVCGETALLDSGGDGATQLRISDIGRGARDNASVPAVGRMPWERLNCSVAGGSLESLLTAGFDAMGDIGCDEAACSEIALCSGIR